MPNLNDNFPGFYPPGDWFTKMYPFTTFHEQNLNWLVKTVEYLEWKMKQMVDYGEDIKEIKEEIANIYTMINKAMGLDLVDDANYNLFAQVVHSPNSTNAHIPYYTPQGFCIANVGINKYCLNLFIDEVPGFAQTNTVILTNMADGSRRDNIGIGLGHSNSCTYCPDTNTFFVCTGGGDPNTLGNFGYLQELDMNLNVGRFKGTFNNCWAIAYSDHFLYVIGTNDNTNNQLAKVDPMTLETIETYPITLDTDTFIYQGMAADDQRLYLFNGNNITGDNDINNINRISVLDKTGKPIKQIYSSFPVEMQEGDFDGEDFYICANSAHYAVIAKHDLYAKNRRCTWGRAYENTEVNNAPIEVYCKWSYKDFLMNGLDASTPLSTMAWLVFMNRNSTTRINFNILDDQDQAGGHEAGWTLSIRKFPNTVLSIIGNGYYLPNLLVESMDDLYITNAKFRGMHGTGKYTIEYHGSRLVLNDIQFGEDPDVTDPDNPVFVTVRPDRLIFTTAPFEIGTESYSITIVQDAEWLLYSLNAGFIRRCNFRYPGVKYRVNASSMGVMYQSFNMQKIKTGGDGIIQNNPIFWATFNQTVDMHELRYPCNVSLIGGTITNLPAGVTNTNCNYVEIRPIRTNESQPNNTIIKCYMNDGTIVQERYSFTTS